MNKLTAQLDTLPQGAGSDRISQVMDELDQLKRQSERLDLINRLHGRMTGVLSMAEMIETYSVWLTPIVDHELIGYSNSVRNKKHLFCSSHGPGRRRAIAFAEKLIETVRNTNGVVSSDDGIFGHRWIFENVDDTGILLILKEGEELSSRELKIINESMVVLADSLRRALEYEELFERASTDALTGLANRRVFEDRIVRLMDSANRYNTPLTMLSLDLDRFKDINDNLGHQAGDDALVRVAKILSETVRSTDLLVRIGGDEFLVILDNTDQKSAAILAERLVRKVDGLDIWANDQVKLGVSIGCAQLLKGESLKAWMERTDDYLYHAKDHGKAQVSVA